jgi:hypothetical protein
MVSLRAPPVMDATECKTNTAKARETRLASKLNGFSFLRTTRAEHCRGGLFKGFCLALRGVSGH